MNIKAVGCWGSVGPIHYAKHIHKQIIYKGMLSGMKARWRKAEGDA